MKSLASCLKSAGKAISPSDGEFVKESRAEYIASGLSSKAATNLAVNDLISSLNESIAAIEQEIESEGGNIEKPLYSTTVGNSEWENSGVDENGWPVFQGDGFVLDPIYKALWTENDFAPASEKVVLDLGHAAHVPDSAEVWAFSIRNTADQEVGVAKLQVDKATNEIVGIHDIKIHHAKNGLGTQILDSIMTNTSRPVKIIEMLDQSWPFWQKMGVTSKDEYRNGILTKKQYIEGRERREQSRNLNDGEKLEEISNEEIFDQGYDGESVLPYQQSGIEDAWFTNESAYIDHLNKESVNESRREFLKVTAGIAVTIGAVGGGYTRSVTGDGLTKGKAKPIPEEVLRKEFELGVSDKLIIKPRSLKDVLEMIKDDVPAELKSLYDQVVKLAPDNIMVSLDPKSKVNAHGVASFDGDKISVSLFSNGKREGNTYGTLLHESLHAVVLARFKGLDSAIFTRNFKKVGKPLPESNPQIQQIYALWKEYKRSTNLMSSGQRSQFKDSVWYDQAYSSLDEFFVRALTDVDFQAHLATFEYKGKTLLQQFKDWVKGLFVQEGTIPTWLDAALYGANDLLSAMEKDKPDSEIVKAFYAYNRRDSNQHALYRTDEQAEIEVEGFEQKELSYFENAITYVQDKMFPLKKVIKSIENSGAEITDAMNTYELDELMPEKITLQLDGLKDNYVKKITELMRDADVSLESVNSYLYAKHAPSRNKVIAERYANATPEEMAKFEDMTPELFKDGGSGMTNAEAAGIIALAKKDGKTEGLERISTVVQNMMESKLDIMENAGLLSNKQRNVWANMFDDYVPLKGHQAEGMDEQVVIGRTGKGYAITGNESLHMMGRRTQAPHILATAIQDYTSAVIRAEKNKVSQSFALLAKNNKDPTYWGVHDKDHLPERMTYDPSTNSMKNHKMTVFEMTKENQMLGFKANGKQMWVRVEDTQLFEAMHNLGPEAMSGVIKYMAIATRGLSALNTSLNPEFMISNASRDIQTAIMNLLGESSMQGGKLLNVGTKEEKLALVAKISSPASIISAMNGIRKGINDPADTKDWSGHWKDFREQGGKTGWFDMKPADEQAKDVEKLVQIENGTPYGKFLKAKRGAFEFIDKWNTVIENGVRLSTYVHAVEAGLSKQKAASLAKNLTVNFNRKGKITWLNAIYMFGNASVQGSAQFVRTVLAAPWKHPSGKIKTNWAQKAAGLMTLSGYMLAMLARETGGEDEDGEKWFDKIEDHVLERNLVIMKSSLGGPEDGTYWKIPLPYGYNIFHNLGTVASAMESGSKRKTKSWAAKFLSMSALGSFSPIGISTSDQGVAQGIFKTITPTLAKPFAEIALDENFFGSTIFRDTRYDRATVPDYVGKEKTPAHWKTASKFLSDLTNDKSYGSGWIDLAPETFQHILSSYAGGFGRLADYSADSAVKAIKGEEVEDRKVPFLRKVTGSVSQYGNRNDFYERKDEILQADEHFKSLRRVDRVNFRRENSDILSMRGIIKTTDRKLRSYRKKIKSLKAREPEGFEATIEFWKEKEKNAITKFNTRYNELFDNS